MIHVVMFGTIQSRAPLVGIFELVKQALANKCQGAKAATVGNLAECFPVM
jgi:hypothetical protein